MWEVENECVGVFTLCVIFVEARERETMALTKSLQYLGIEPPKLTRMPRGPIGFTFRDPGRYTQKVLKRVVNAVDDCSGDDFKDLQMLDTWAAKFNIKAQQLDSMIEHGHIKFTKYIEADTRLDYYNKPKVMPLARAFIEVEDDDHVIYLKVDGENDKDMVEAKGVACRLDGEPAWDDTYRRVWAEDAADDSYVLVCMEHVGKCQFCKRSFIAAEKEEEGIDQRLKKYLFGEDDHGEPACDACKDNLYSCENCGATYNSDMAALECCR